MFRDSAFTWVDSYLRHAATMPGECASANKRLEPLLNRYGYSLIRLRAHEPWGESSDRRLL